MASVLTKLCNNICQYAEKHTGLQLHKQPGSNKSVTFEAEGLQQAIRLMGHNQGSLLTGDYSLHWSLGSHFVGSKINLDSWRVGLADFFSLYDSGTRNVIHKGTARDWRHAVLLDVIGTMNLLVNDSIFKVGTNYATVKRESNQFLSISQKNAGILLAANPHSFDIYTDAMMIGQSVSFPFGDPNTNSGVIVSEIMSQLVNCSEHTRLETKSA